MKKIFACSNGIDFVSSIAIDKSYVQLPKVVEIEIVIVVNLYTL